MTRHTDRSAPAGPVEPLDAVLVSEGAGLWGVHVTRLDGALADRGTP